MVEHQWRVQDKQQNCAAHTLTLTHTSKQKKKAFKNHRRAKDACEHRNHNTHELNSNRLWMVSPTQKFIFNSTSGSSFFCLLIHLVFFLLSVNRKKQILFNINHLPLKCLSNPIKIETSKPIKEPCHRNR